MTHCAAATAARYSYDLAGTATSNLSRLACRIHAPSKFSIETAPLPTDERIMLREVPGQLVAVVRYSGRWTERNYEKHKGRLIKSLEAAEIESLGTVEFAAYNAPFVLPFLRRNEVMIEVKSVPKSNDLL